MRTLIRSAFFLLLLAACKGKTDSAGTPAATENLITRHKYWVSKAYHDALFSPNVIDTVGYLNCAEVVFQQKDTLLLTACLSDAGPGTYKITGPNSLELRMSGMEDKPVQVTFDEKTGILHVPSPAGEENTYWPTEFVAHDGINVSDLDDVTINLGRQRLAGTYSILPPKGEVAIASMVELKSDGTQLGFGDFDTFEPWPAGINASCIQNPPLNLMYFTKKGQEADAKAMGWQLRGDTLRIWETVMTSAEGDLPEYKPGKLYNTYIKSKAQ